MPMILVETFSARTHPFKRKKPRLSMPNGTARPFGEVIARLWAKAYIPT